MRLIVTAFLLLALGGCGRSEPMYAGSSQPEVGPPDADARPRRDFDILHERLETLNASTMPNFEAKWPELRDDLDGYITSGRMAELTVEQQEKIYADLDYLRSCYHPQVLREHGDEIESLMKHLALSDETRELVESSKRPR